MVAGDHMPTVHQPGGVVQSRIRAIDESGQDRAAARGSLRQVLQGGEVVPDELRAEQQVLGRIAGDCQLRETDEVGAGLGGPGGPCDHPVHVPTEVADRRVDLPERDPDGHGPASLAPGYSSGRYRSSSYGVT